MCEKIEIITNVHTVEDVADMHSFEFVFLRDTAAGPETVLPKQ